MPRERKIINGFKSQVWEDENQDKTLGSDRTKSLRPEREVRVWEKPAGRERPKKGTVPSQHLERETGVWERKKGAANGEEE